MVRVSQKTRYATFHHVESRLENNQANETNVNMIKCKVNTKLKAKIHLNNN